MSLGLIRTEVVLKFIWENVPGAFSRFNKNRSCIEMLGIKTENITKFTFNKNRSCIEIDHWEMLKTMQDSLIRTAVVLI